MHLRQTTALLLLALSLPFEIRSRIESDGAGREWADRDLAFRPNGVDGTELEPIWGT
jgi:hypothetical protein